MDHIGKATVVAVHRIEICDLYGITIDGVSIGDRIGEFAKSDGFKSWADMLDFFDTHYDLPFRGVLIRWELLPKLNPSPYGIQPNQTGMPEVQGVISGA